MVACVSDWTKTKPHLQLINHLHRKIRNWTFQRNVEHGGKKMQDFSISLHLSVFLLVSRKNNQRDGKLNLKEIMTCMPGDYKSVQMAWI